MQDFGTPRWEIFFSPIFCLISGLECPSREEHSMDRCWSRPKLSENFERHCSIRISGEIHMDQSLVHTFSWGSSYGPMVLKVLLKFPPLHWYWSMDGSSQPSNSCRPSEGFQRCWMGPHWVGPWALDVLT